MKRKNINFNEEECFNYSKNIDIESELRNNNKILSNHPNNTYIPNIKSQMYSYSIPKTDNTAELKYPDLFNNSNYFDNIKTSYSHNLGQNNYIFNSSTRNQIKD